MDQAKGASCASAWEANDMILHLGLWFLCHKIYHQNFGSTDFNDSFRARFFLYGLCCLERNCDYPAVSSDRLEANVFSKSDDYANASSSLTHVSANDRTCRRGPRTCARRTISTCEQAARSARTWSAFRDTVLVLWIRASVPWLIIDMNIWEDTMMAVVAFDEVVDTDYWDAKMLYELVNNQTSH